MTDSHDHARTAILARYRRLCAEHQQMQETVDTVVAHQRELTTQINDCFAAARLFGFDLVAEFQSEAKEDPRQSSLEAPDPIAPKLSPVPPAPAARSAQSVKMLVLEAVEKAHPNPVRAADVRRELANKGYAVHEKTVGMTLYRWSRTDVVRRAGRDWFFVPPGQRKHKANGHRYRPGRDSLFAASVEQEGAHVI